MWKHSILFIAASVLFVTTTAAAAPAVAELAGPNDNTRAAGALERGTLTVRLRAAAGTWRPEGPDGPALAIEAFGVEGGALMVPAPLIRVTEGTMLAVSIRNDLATPLRVNGGAR